MHYIAAIAICIALHYIALYKIVLYLTALHKLKHEIDSIVEL